MLTPTHVDTNSLFITERLNELGIDLQGKGIAGDDRDVLKSIVSDALGRTDLLILTGGLGPTDDDLTRDVVADLIGRPLEYHAHIFEAIEMRFAARGLRTPEINRRQAMVPKGAAVLPNKNGTAPGLWIEHERKLIVLLPGPPRELKPMFEAVIQERLLGHVGASRLFRRLLRITGQTESYVEEKMQPLYARWLSAPTRITTTILASLGQIELHLTAIASSADDGHRALDGAVADVSRDARPRFVQYQQRDDAAGRGGDAAFARLEDCGRRVVHRRARDGAPHRSARKLRRTSIAESWCTAISRKPICSACPPSLIAAHGAVSEPVAEAMASGMVRSAGADVALGVTGVAGPTGGTPEKPVGMVAIAAAWARNGIIETRVRTFNFVGGREMVRFQASQAALDMVRRWMTE